MRVLPQRVGADGAVQDGEDARTSSAEQRERVLPTAEVVGVLRRTRLQYVVTLRRDDDALEAGGQKPPAKAAKTVGWSALCGTALLYAACAQGGTGTLRGRGAYGWTHPQDTRLHTPGGADGRGAHPGRHRRLVHHLEVCALCCAALPSWRLTLPPQVSDGALCADRGHGGRHARRNGGPAAGEWHRDYAL